MRTAIVAEIAALCRNERHTVPRKVSTGRGADHTTDQLCVSLSCQRRGRTGSAAAPVLLQRERCGVVWWVVCEKTCY